MKYIPYQTQYYNILSELLLNPRKIGKSRVGNIHGTFVRQMRCDLAKEFPLQNIKQMSLKNIYVELLWFLKGETNIKFLVDNKCNIWNDDAYRWYQQKLAPDMEKSEFLEKVKNESGILLTDKDGNVSFFYTFGDLGEVYGQQWRNFEGKVDQINEVIKTLKTNPDDRRMIVTAHNPAALARGNVALPSCHNYMQFYTEPQESGRRKLSVFFNMRSADFALGVPYNMASYSMLLMMMAQVVDMDLGEVVCNMVDCHLYEQHFEGAKIWMERYEEIFNNNPQVEDPFLCNAKIDINGNIKDIDGFGLEDIRLVSYSHLGKIEMPLLT